MTKATDQTSLARRRRSALSLLLMAIICQPGCGTNGPTTSSSNSKSTPRITEKPAPEPTRLVEKSPPVKPASADPAVEPAVDATVPGELAMPEAVLRPDDQRPKHDDQKLAELGIRAFESQRLKLYTDIDPRIAETLPPVIDQAYQALVDYFGPLAPDKARTEFQMTGYLIKDDALFREAGLIPLDLPPFEHGRHRRNEFWMREQKYDYYRRHLLIHEVTHCFMTIMPGTEAPVWYMEGMAECFGTHRIGADGKLEFRVMPTSPEDYAGSGRVTVVSNDCADGKPKGISQILDFRPEEFLKTEYYAWSWALCTFLDTHPRYQKRFREMGGYLQRNAFPTQFYRTFEPDSRDLATEWTLFSQNLQYGYDTSRAAIDFQPGTELTEQQPRREVRIESDRGWQSSGVVLQEGHTYKITATGQFELASQPKPWISEPQGISFRYFKGLPLGLLVGCLRNETGDAGGATESMLKILPLGRDCRFRAPVSGTLYLRVNDEWNSLRDNRGSVMVQIRSE